MRTNLRLTLISLSVSLLFTACGGGGGSSGTSSPAGSTGTQNTGTTGATDTPANPGGSTNTGGTTTTTGNLPAAVPATASMTMSCPDIPAAGLSEQCSGGGIIRTDNGVALSSSGVQVYGRSTSDLKIPIAHPESATGFELASGGLAEVRLVKNDASTTNSVAAPALLLSNLGIKWDGKNESPQIVETFQTTQGRVRLGANRDILADTFHPHTDTAFYDFGTKGAAGATQANYANNRYFPRTDPSRCPTEINPCPTAETAGITPVTGDWRIGGTVPDETSSTRLHEDGDVHAGDGVTGGTGPGVPFPGSKGYRDFYNMSYRYANMTKWVSQDTAEIVEWAGTSNEHNLNRRGIVAFGAVSDPAKIPTAGAATYSGFARGWYAPNASAEPTSFRAEATVKVDFATRQVSVTLANAKTDDTAGTPLPVTFTTTVGMGDKNTNVANYLNGTVATGNLKGGIGGRYFGPSDAATVPPEVGASFSMSDAGTGAAVIGGFIARKQ